MEKNTLEFEKVTTAGQIAQTAALANVIWHECYAHILKPAQVDYMVDRMQSAEAIGKQIAEEGYAYYLIMVDGVAAGYLGVQPMDGRLLLSKLYLEAAYRGRGYSQGVMDFVEELGKKENCAAVWLTVNRSNERAISMYRKVGYHSTGEVDTDIGGGYTMNDFVFEKPL